MKFPLFIYAFFLWSFATGQKLYSQPKNEFHQLFEPLLIKKGQEPDFFNYAVKLYRLDSLKKAGQLFDRIYQLDASSHLAKQSLKYRRKIEEKVIQQAKNNLNNTWNWSWSGTNWGPSNYPSKSKSTKHIQFDGKTIKFYENDSLIRQTTYVLTQTFDWSFGFLTTYVRYNDTQEEWSFNLADLESFTSDQLWISQKSAYACGSYGECYLLAK